MEAHLSPINDNEYGTYMYGYVLYSLKGSFVLQLPYFAMYDAQIVREK